MKATYDPSLDDRQPTRCFFAEHQPSHRISALPMEIPAICAHGPPIPEPPPVE
jgi:hypothetical protein